MGKRADGMIRARVRRDGRGVELGYFKTKEEIAAAQEVAHAILDEWDAIKAEAPKLPSPYVLIDMIHQGSYDSTIEALAVAVIQRQRMIKRMESQATHKVGNWDSTLTSSLNAKKWQAMKRQARQERF